jgi:hypothetical protein
MQGWRDRSSKVRALLLAEMGALEGSQTATVQLSNGRKWGKRGSRNQTRHSNGFLTALLSLLKGVAGLCGMDE